MKHAVVDELCSRLNAGVLLSIEQITQMLAAEGVTMKHSNTDTSAVRQFCQHYEWQHKHALIDWQRQQSSHPFTPIHTVWCSKIGRHSGAPVIRMVGAIALCPTDTRTVNLKLWREITTPESDSASDVAFVMLTLAIIAASLNWIQSNLSSTVQKPTVCVWMYNAISEARRYVTLLHSMHLAGLLIRGSCLICTTLATETADPSNTAPGFLNQSMWRPSDTTSPGTTLGDKHAAMGEIYDNDSDKQWSATQADSVYADGPPGHTSNTPAQSGVDTILDGLEALCANQNQSTHAITNWLSAIGVHLQALSAARTAPAPPPPVEAITPVTVPEFILPVTQKHRSRPQKPIVHGAEHRAPLVLTRVKSRNVAAADESIVRDEIKPRPKTPGTKPVTNNSNRHQSGHKKSRHRHKRKSGRESKDVQVANTPDAPPPPRKKRRHDRSRDKVNTKQ